MFRFNRTTRSRRADVHPEMRRKLTQLFIFLTGGLDQKYSRKITDQLGEKFLENNALPLEKREQIAEMFDDIYVALYPAKSYTCGEFIDRRQELLTYHAGTLSLEITKLYKRMFRIIDLNHDAEIDMNEFAMYCEATGEKDRASIERAFKVIDKNGDGGITEDEYIEAYIKYNMDCDVTLEQLPIYGLPRS